MNKAFEMTLTFSSDTFLLQFQRLYIQVKFEQYFSMKMQNVVEIKFLILRMTTAFDTYTEFSLLQNYSCLKIKFLYVFTK
jgi:hypothetical protein